MLNSAYVTNIFCYCIYKMAPKLYRIIGSPPSGAVQMCGKVLGIELEFEELDLFNSAHLTEDFILKNPQHTVPLLDDDGFVLADSHAINGYLVGAYGKENDPLYPKNDIKRRALIDHRLHLDSSIIAARGLLASKPLVLDDIKPTQLSLDNLKEAFAILDKQIEVQNSKYMVGNVLSIADFSITTTVTSWGFFVANWEEKFINVKSYIDRMKEEDWYDANEEGLKVFHDIFKLKFKQFA